MGEVYRATDTKLGRDVALKLLPEAFAADAERLARFEREAKLLASLNHPGIAHLYSFDAVPLADGRTAHVLAMELVEGEDLAARLKRGALPVGEALEIAKQVAEALEEAHSKSIVHRDLKPANVKLTPEGRVKVLDFGLAKAWAGDAAGVLSSASALSESPTLAHSGTVAGVILGTAAYMSPEQARGKPVDKRADVWSFGVLLWEMLTGRALFTGDTVTDVIAAVVTREPDMDALPQGTPRTVRQLLTRCLRKDVRARMPDIGGARLELHDALAGVEDGTSADHDEQRLRTVERQLRRERWTWAALALGVSVVAASLAFSMRLGPTKRRASTVAFAIPPPQGWRFADYGIPVPSPDGSQIVFVARQGPRGDLTAHSQLWLRPLDSVSARPLAGTDGGNQGVPFWSPDGRSIGFFAGGELRRLDLADGTARKICRMPAANGIGGDWNRDGTILFDAGGVFRVPAAGGEPTPLTRMDDSRGERAHYAPQFLPDGRRFLLVISAAGAENSGLFVTSLETPTVRQRVAPQALHYAFAAGQLLFTREGTLYAQPFDVTRARLTGEAVAIVSGIAAWLGYDSVGQFGVSAGGTLAYHSGRGAMAPMQLAWLDRKGSLLAKVGAPAAYDQIALSPDGRSMVFSAPGEDRPQTDLWTMDLQRGVATRVTATPESEFDAIWSPDGQSLAFSVEANGDISAEVRRKSLRAGEPDAVLVSLPDRCYPEHWSSAGGGTLLFLRHTGDVKTAWALPLGGGEPIAAVRSAASWVDEPQLSPDGRWITYMSRESGRFEVYVEPFRRDGERARVSIDGGGQPRWRADGRELFYATPEGRIMAVAVRAAAERLDLGLPAELFKVEGMRPSGEFDDFAVAADGQRFLVKLPTVQEEGFELHTVVNWTSLLPQSAR